MQSFLLVEARRSLCAPRFIVKATTVLSRLVFGFSLVWLRGFFLLLTFYFTDMAVSMQSCLCAGSFPTLALRSLLP